MLNIFFQVTQIECSSVSRPPSGCAQYFTGVSGTFQSYNFDGGFHLNYQDYRWKKPSEKNVRIWETLRIFWKYRVTIKYRHTFLQVLKLLSGRMQAHAYSLSPSNTTCLRTFWNATNWLINWLIDTGYACVGRRVIAKWSMSPPRIHSASVSRVEATQRGN